MRERLSAMRVLFAARVLDRPTTELLIRLSRAGVALDVAYKPDCRFYDQLSQAGISLFPVRYRGRLDRVAIGALRRRLAERPCDILHAINSYPLSCGLLATRGSDVRVVCYRGYEGNVSFLRPQAWMTFLNPRVDRICCNSQAVARFFLGLRLFRLRVPPAKVRVIHKGHDLAWYDAPATDLAAFGIPAGAPVIGFCGRDRPRKGVHVLVEALERLTASPAAHLVLVGRHESTALRRRVAASPARERIHFAGFRRDAPQIAAACDLFAMPSLEREGFPRAVVEAMAYGTPAVVTDAGGMPELVEHGVSGLVVPQGDAGALAAAIDALLGDGARRAEMGRRARERIGTVFTCDRTAEAVLAVYRELMAGR